MMDMIMLYYYDRSVVKFFIIINKPIVCIQKMQSKHIGQIRSAAYGVKEVLGQFTLDCIMPFAV